MLPIERRVLAKIVAHNKGNETKAEHVRRNYLLTHDDKKMMRFFFFLLQKVPENISASDKKSFYCCNDFEQPHYKGLQSRIL